MLDQMGKTPIIQESEESRELRIALYMNTEAPDERIVFGVALIFLSETILYVFLAVRSAEAGNA
jgi:hypothetical protein